MLWCVVFGASFRVDFEDKICTINRDRLYNLFDDAVKKLT